jgi:ubiquinone/menaquinone biosynthesis C-methylase UbiE
MEKLSLNLVTRKKTYNVNLYNGDYFVVSHIRKFIVDSIIKYLSPGFTVVDIGCGEQPFCDLIKGMNATYIGVDIIQNSQNTVDVVAPITEIPLTSYSLDLIICTEVLEHVSDTYKAFKELSRLIKPGGVIIITVPFTYPLHEEPFDFVRLTPYQITQCARDNNLNIVELITSGNELEVVATVLDNMWIRMNSKNFSKNLFFLMGLISRIVINSAVIVLSKLVGDYLPKKYYLNTLCILSKNK